MINMYYVPNLVMFESLQIPMFTEQEVQSILRFLIMDAIPDGKQHVMVE